MTKARTRAGGGSRARAAASPAADDRSATARAQEAVAWLERNADPKTRAGMARYGIVTDRAFGLPMKALQEFAKGLGRDHALAEALWESGWYEARVVAAYVADPAAVTPEQMDRWAGDFDNWGICDTVCFVLFDRTPHAFGRIEAWARHRDEFVRRAAFALLASVALHDRETADARFVRCLRLVERAATDDRNFVKKGVSWSLRAIGHRTSGLHASAVALAEELAASEDGTARWIGKDALRDLTRPAVLRAVAKKPPRGD